MRIARWFSVALACALLLMPLASAAAEPLEPDVRDHPADQTQGYGLCFQSSVLFGVMTIGGGCYSPYLVRTNAGAYLGLALPGSPLIHPGQIVYLGTPAGNRLWGALRYLLPLVLVAPGLIPLNSVQTVPAHLVPNASRLIVPMPGGATQPVVINFVVR